MIDEEKVLLRIQWEKGKRRVVKDGFIPFCNAFGYELARHHRLIANKLERAITEPNYNLIICMPPGHAKSRYASILFPSYYLGMFPGKSVIMASHTAELAGKWGRACKRIIDDLKYQYIMGVKLKKDSQSSDRFDLSNGSEYFACGVGGAIAGQRADLAIIDDPIRSKEDAESDTIRNKIWDWYVNDFCTRAKPDASKVVIMTRWHEDDLVGRILDSPDKDNWDILSLPAIAEPNDALGREVGEALWPDYIPVGMLENIRKVTNKKTWHSLYQQNPAPDEGVRFRKEFIKIVEHIPQNLSIYGASDYALTRDGGDYTAHVVCGHDPKTDDLYIIDLWRGQVELNEGIEKFIDLCLKHKPITWAEEKGMLFQSANSYIEKAMVTRRCFTNRKQFSVGRGSIKYGKEIRAISFENYFSDGRVKILDREWTNELIAEMIKFPSGKHDDQVDALGLIGRMLEEMRRSPEKKRSQTQYEFNNNMLILPGLQEKVSRDNQGAFRKF